MNAQQLNQLAQLDQIDEASFDHKVFIYKHSTSCMTSSMALNRLKRQWDDSAVLGTDFFFLDLLAFRNISNAIEARYGVRHQSPQVLVISKGKCIFETSHFGINFKDLAQAVTV